MATFDNFELDNLRSTKQRQEYNKHTAGVAPNYCNHLKYNLRFYFHLGRVIMPYVIQDVINLVSGTYDKMKEVNN
jgi:hypothetical protein